MFASVSCLFYKQNWVFIKNVLFIFTQDIISVFAYKLACHGWDIFYNSIFIYKPLHTFILSIIPPPLPYTRDIELYNPIEMLNINIIEYIEEP